MPRALFTSRFVPTQVEELKALTSLSDFRFMEQVHGNFVAVVDDQDTQTPTADALVTTVKGIGLVVRSADCLPILISSELVVAAVHAGRKGVTNGVISATVSKMRELGGENFQAIIGPAICGQCYEVEEVMYNEIISKFPAGATSQDRHCLDIGKMATFELEAAGVNVTHHGFCTKENLDFYSYRRDKASGRQVGIITL